MLHANGLLSRLASENKCSMVDLIFEMDRILRPEVMFKKLFRCSHRHIYLNNFLHLVIIMARLAGMGYFF